MAEAKESKSKNTNLRKAKETKNDEFYTQYQDIANEIGHYRQHFKGKVVYCNCDDPTWSNFWRYFHNNFASLGLKKLISTHYQANSEPSYCMEYTGGNDFDMDAGKITPILGDKGEDGKQIYTAGDFRSQACIKLLKEADIVITNPPFSLFREYIGQLMEYEKKFILIGNLNAITYKEFFPLLKDNKVWMGYNSVKEFKQPDGTFKKFGNVCWYTNLDLQKRHDGLWHLNGKFDKTQAHCYYEGNEDKYPKYDNYDAINVDKTSMIPIDYTDVMGVPITFLDKYNPEEFEIIGFFNNYKPETAGNGFIYGEAVHVTSTKSLFRGPVINGKAIYFRILIRNRNPIAKKDDK